MIPRRAFLTAMGLLLMGTAGRAGEPPPIMPDLSLAVTVDESRAGDFEGELVHLLSPKGFRGVRNQTPLPTRPHRKPQIVHLYNAAGTMVHLDNVFGVGRFNVAIYAAKQDKTWPEVGDEILRIVESLPYCKVIDVKWRS